ncbi:MAG: DNA polymerase I [Lachnospiraceae bacterium]|nr:DNA polymerase I [Lachnospiraceae bacterium]
MNNLKKIVLIDGNSILNRAFYGLPELTNAKGLHTNAILGFLNIMLKILEEEKPDTLFVAFDVKHPTFRHEMFKEYKGTRKPMPDNLREQLPVIKEVLQSMNIKIVEKPGFEADDILGTLGVMAEKEDYDVRIISGDRDLLQLATKKVMIRIPKTIGGKTTVENYYEDDVFAKYGVTPTEFIDLKALMGDTSDNIPGVKGIGEKTAISIISKYKNIENAIANVAEITPNRAKTAIEEYKEDARMSKVLATINTNVPLEITLNDGVINEMFNDKAYNFFLELGFKSLISKYFDSSTMKSADFNLEEHIKIVENSSELKNILKLIDEKGKYGFAGNIYKTENYQLSFDFFGGSNDSSDDVNIAVCVDDMAYYISSKNVKRNEIDEFIATLTNKKQIKVSLFALKDRLYDFGFDKNNQLFDVSILAYLLNPNKNFYSAFDIAAEHLNLLIDSFVEKFEPENIKKLYNEDSHKYIMLTCLNSYIANSSLNVLWDKVSSANMADLYLNVELPLVFSLFKMENEGIKINASELKDYGVKLAEGISVLEKEIYEDTGVEFNINSPKQLGEVLFEKLGYEGGKKTKTGYSTSADVLEKMSSQYPVVDKILQYRQLTKLKSTYADGLINYVGADNRIHGTFNQTITATGRISSTEPNLQNIPIRFPLGKEIRKVFVPKEGHVFIDADYSQIELRILAHMSDDEALIDAYNSYSDIHKITAAKVFNTPLDEVTDVQRSNAKAVNFGIVYGISSFGLSQDLSISKKQANEYIEQYFATYPKIKEFLDKNVADAKNTGFVTTMFNRLRPIPELKSSNFMQRSFGERIAMNSPIQGTAADIMKIAMINVDKALENAGLNAKIVLQVHDELLLEVPTKEVEQVKEIVVHEMSNAAKLKVALEVSVGVGKNWLEAH